MVGLGLAFYVFSLGYDGAGAFVAIASLGYGPLQRFILILSEK